MDRRQVLTHLLTYFGKSTQTVEHTVDIYLLGLDDIADSILAPALAELIKTSTFCPRVNEIRDACRNVIAAQSEAGKVTGDQLLAKLNQMYDDALAGEFDADNFMRHVLLLRNSDRETAAEGWRAKYDWLKAGMPDDPERRHKYAEWESVDEAAFNPEAMRTIQL